MAKISPAASEPPVPKHCNDRPLHASESAATRLRWLILASLGPAAAAACGGRSFVTDLDDDVGFAVGGTGGSGVAAIGGSSNAGQGGTTYGGQGGLAQLGGAAGFGGVGTGGSGGTSQGNGGDSFGVPQPTVLVPGACNSATSLGGGFERCETGQLHRPGIDLCPSLLPRNTSFTPDELVAIQVAAIERGLGSVEGVASILPCFEDRQCTAAANGYCRATPNADQLSECRYGCVSDRDCESGSICLCGDPVGTCVPALCDSGAECNGLRCVAYDPSPACSAFSLLPVFKCQTYQDECAHDGHCTPGTYCTSIGDRFACVGGGCDIPGRPFLVDAVARLARSEPRADFSERGALAEAALHPLVAADAELRLALAQAWTRVGLMEHASIAAFARFALQLLALGAPPELLTSTARAIEDETRHARHCFALARRYSGEEIGPGALDVSDAVGTCDLREAVLTSIEEGCIGETLAALQAAEAAQHCIDPATRAVLEGIARDEAEHAALAWRFVAWALPRCSEAIVAEVRAKFGRALQDEPRPAASIGRSERELLHFGVVGPRVSAELRRTALREILLPCAEALLGSLGDARPARAGAPLLA